MPVEIKRVEMNGQPGAVSMDPDGRLLNVLTFDVSDGRIRTIRSIVNPDKLAHLGPVGDLPSLLGRRRKAQ